MKKFSYTMYNTYKHCPLLYKRRYLDNGGVGAVKNVRTANGIKIHNQINNCAYDSLLDGVVNGQKNIKVDTFNFQEKEEKKVPKTIQKPQQEFIEKDENEWYNIKKIYTSKNDLKIIYLEQYIKYDTDIVRLVGILDYMCLVKDHLKFSSRESLVKSRTKSCEIVDWKTGSTSSAYHQLNFYAMLVLNRIPELKEVKTSIGKITTEVEVMNVEFEKERIIRRSDLGCIEKEIMGVVHRAMTDTTFKKSTSYLCNYCDFPCREGLEYKEIKRNSYI